MSMRACWKCKGAGGRPRCWCERCGGTGQVRDLEAGDIVVFWSSLRRRIGRESVKWEVEARKGGFGFGRDAVVRAVASGQRMTVEASRLQVVRTTEERVADACAGRAL